MCTLNVGIATLEQHKKRTMAIARGEYVPARNEPKVWFQSLETMSQVLSDKNRALLALIVKTQPQSLTELAEKTGRAKSNLSRTLKTMERYGLVYFEQAQDARSRPACQLLRRQTGDDLPIAAQPSKPKSANWN